MHSQVSSIVVGAEIDEYRVDALLGRGGMGVVYKATDTLLERSVALKLIMPELAEDEAFVRRFHTEARALAQIQHPNIVLIYFLRETSRGLYIAMEYVEGETLAARLEREHAMPWGTVLPIAKQLLGALAYAHDKGVLHRDIKPRNIMLTPQGSVKIMDFGLAKVVREGSDTTVTKAQAGTLHYMSPEQVAGSGLIDHRSDLFSLGMTLYQMFVGRLPFDKDGSQLTILKTIAEGKFPRPLQFNPALPRALSRIIMKALQKDPRKRYQSAGEMLADLEAFEERVSVEEKGRSVPGRSLSQKKGRGVRFWVSVVALLILGCGGYFLWSGLAHRPSSTDAISESAMTAAAPEDHPGVGVMRTDTTRAASDEEAATVTTGDDTELPPSDNQSEGGHYEAAPASTMQTTETPPADGQDPGEDTEIVAMTGVLRLGSSPEGAQIFIDGRPHGTTPRTISEVAAGQHTITFRLGGYEDRTEPVDVVAQQTRSVNVSLVARMGTLQVGVNPWGRLYVDGEMRMEQVDILQSLELPAGRHIVTVEHPSFGKWQRSVTITTDTPQAFVVDFTRLVKVTVIVQDVQGNPLEVGAIFVDGQPTGLYAPGTVEMRVGLHTIEVRADGYVLDGTPPVINVEQDHREPVRIVLREEDS